MKKKITIVFCIFILLSLVGCGGSDAANNNTSTNNNQSLDNESLDNESVKTETTDDAIKSLEKQFVALKEDNIEWDYNSSSKTIIISGEGPMKDYLDAPPEWDVYYAEAEHVVISDKVTSVGAGAFLFFSALNDVDLGNTVEFVGDAAFSNCIALRSVDFSPNLKYVGIGAFNNALLHSETGFVFPEGMLYIGNDAFRSAFKENTVSIPASLSYIGEGAFANTFVSGFLVDENNPNYASADGVLYDKQISTLINYPADKKDVTYEIPNTVTTIKKDAIEVTNTLEKIIIPAGVSKIDEESIFWNYALTNIEVDSNNKNYKLENDVLYTADGKLLICYPIASNRTEYSIIEGCERICDYALSQANNLVELHASEGLKEIGCYSLYLCNSLEKVGLPKGLKIIDSNAFNYCDALTRIDFTGSSDDWKQVEIKDKNELLTDGRVQIYCVE